jgi:hypothetical protein
MANAQQQIRKRGQDKILAGKPPVAQAYLLRLPTARISRKSKNGKYDLLLSSKLNTKTL